MNRLQFENSPYLLQHKNNPVNWFPWGQEAFDRAIIEDKPILLSIGYSSCHWCHVMEKESFENPEIAGIMNENFINIKVDREERPDVDKIYMNFVQLTTGSGGWPLTLALTPQLIPFFGGTYFPPEDRYGKPGFRKVLMLISNAYHIKKNEILMQNEKVVNLLEEMNYSSAGDSTLSKNDFDKAFLSIKSEYDPNWGGFGNPPKFPCPMSYLFLLRYFSQTQNNEALEIIKNSLIKMASGGIYDQIGGGFHRYSTDERWLVPHFEKMLYDNALLSRLYLETYQVTKENFFLEIAEGILTYIQREMTDSSGCFYSSQNADTEDKEGVYFLWRKEDLSSFLSSDEIEIAVRVFNLSDSGNFESFNILTRNGDIKALCSECGLDEETLLRKVSIIKTMMLSERNKRTKPSVDDKILTSWNGLMIYSFAYAYGVTGKKDYLIVAEKCADFIWENCFKNSVLYHSYKNGEVKFHGYFDNYAFMVEALISLYEVTFDEKWLIKAKTLADIMIKKFYDIEYKDFLYSPQENSDLILKVKDQYDNAIPSGNSSAVFSLLKLSKFFMDEEYAKIADNYLYSVWQNVIKYPLSFSYLLCAGYFSITSIREVVIVVKNQDEINEIRKKLFVEYLPFSIITFKAAGAHTDLEFLKDKKILNEVTTFYICEDYVCKKPLLSLDDAITEIKSITTKS